MKAQSLQEIFSQLSPEEQVAVRDFIQFIKGRKESSRPTDFAAAVEEFIAAHPDLLQRLAT
ncbi:MAG TPA: hypothetical protein VM182_07495 [Terriglobia bacterium]|nr:hypothetical protein [Terriglobia bacterium]